MRKENTEKLRKKYGDVIFLELGPGRIDKPRPHATLGLNESADPYCDVYWDLEDGMPFLSESIDIICSNQVLEHISRGNFIYLMNEFWRVLKPGGRMEHCVPDYRSEYAWGDPTHKNIFTPKSFQYFSQRPDGSPFVDSFSDYGIECRFLTLIRVKPGVSITAEMVKPRV